MFVTGAMRKQIFFQILNNRVEERRRHNIADAFKLHGFFDGLRRGRGPNCEMHGRGSGGYLHGPVSEVVGGEEADQRREETLFLDFSLQALQTCRRNGAHLH